jgi:hypothetical protein
MMIIVTVRERHLLMAALTVTSMREENVNPTLIVS